ncbi:MAG: glutamine--tRNA ligase/YqeY domain fusion protein [Spirochaetes bacterium]|nr:glutamine--tRNA ligase/YqeY domain fusion protein [Spirochaetota bacterium]
MEEKRSRNFIEERIEEDIRNNKNDGKVITRFPPEPNGYLHIGHAKSICLNFGLAETYNGRCHLRLDDTNPTKEETEYVDSIQEDIKWLGFDWQDHIYYASDYFEYIYECAVVLIKKGLAYVDSLSAEEIRKFRGTLKEAGKESPFRNRPVEENLELFEKMKNGEFKEGEAVLRAKIDMSSGNICMRDPVIYRIQFSHHHRTGDKWCIYPMYDFTHCLSDSTEGITHSICTLEFENNRALYDWVLENVGTEHRPQQIEFARLNLNYTVMSKRILLQLVKENHVSGWDDPRMPTICGIRRRGYTPESIRDFAVKIGVAKADNVVDMAFLEHCLRNDLNKKANRVMAVLEPVKVIIDNYPDGKVEYFKAVNNPEDENSDSREIPFSKELYIERSDFMEDAPSKFFRLAPGREVRFKFAYYLTCTSIEKNASGEISVIHCTYDPATTGGWSEDGRKVKGTIHWVSAAHALKAEIRLYDRLFTKENPGNVEEGKTFLDYLNPDSLKVINNALVEPSLKNSNPGDIFQFERTGYFCADNREFSGNNLVFNRSVSLKDSWSKIENKN